MPDQRLAIETYSQSSLEIEEFVDEVIDEVFTEEDDFDDFNANALIG